MRLASTAPPADCPRPELATSRYSEDYRFLRDPACRTELWDPIKYIPLGEQAFNAALKNAELTPGDVSIAIVKGPHARAV